ncbi:hypothetical protein RISK_000727 [Rhodopirellula islandica]|uniref:Uncharacterized protein n=1 Tax=Rhodopirellula islandica TaxID=595434 RepID=A0A0J1BK69_RHOIS|nr:hypothetical protein RISK_000727 [Rhodopirellula islandica]
MFHRETLFTSLAGKVTGTDPTTALTVTHAEPFKFTQMERS